MDFTCVEIKNVKYIKLLSLDKKGERELDLTTIHQDQELAYLNIYLIDKNKNKKLLKCIKITNIHPGNSGIPELHLTVSYDGKQYYKIVLKLNGYMYHNSIIDIRHYRKSGFKMANIAIALLALIAIAFVTFFSIGTFRNKFSEREISVNSQIREVDHLTADKTTADRTAADQTTADKTTADQTTADKTTADQTTADKTTADQTAADHTAADQTTADQTAADRTAADKTTADQTTADQPIYASELVDDEAVVYFFPDSSFLTKDAISVLDEVLEILKSSQSLYVEITGHCAYYGTEKGRQEISTERARSVYTYFIANGWTPDKSLRLEGLGLGEIITKDPDKQNLNRRVEIVIKSKTED